jgi:hypothetical protein
MLSEKEFTMSACKVTNGSKAINPLHQNYLDYLYLFLDQMLKCTYCARREGNYKIALQATREAGRIITLMHKIAPEADSVLDELFDPLDSLDDGRSLAETFEDFKALLQPQWEKSGKLAGNPAGNQKKGKEYQKDKVNKKIFPKVGAGPGAVSRFDDLEAGRLDLAALHAIGGGRPLPELLPEFLAAAACKAPATL